MKPASVPPAGLLAPIMAPPAAAQVRIKEPWARGTVAQQKATGLFAQITSTSGGTLAAASSPVAGVVEAHEMATEGSVTKMRGIPGLDLPAGMPVDLMPDGCHVTLTEPKQQPKPGEPVPVTLVIEGDGKREGVDVKALIRPLQGGGSAQAHEH